MGRASLWLWPQLARDAAWVRRWVGSHVVCRCWERTAWWRIPARERPRGLASSTARGCAVTAMAGRASTASATEQLIFGRKFLDVLRRSLPPSPPIWAQVLWTHVVAHGCGLRRQDGGCWWDSGGLRPWSERADDKRRPNRPESAHWHSQKKPRWVRGWSKGARVGLSRPLRFDLVSRQTFLDTPHLAAPHHSALLTTAREEGVCQRRLALASLHLMKSLAVGEQ